MDLGKEENTGLERKRPASHVVSKDNLALVQYGFDHMDEGISMYDSELRLVAWNRAFIELTDFPVEIVKVGVLLTDLIKFNIDRGSYGEGDSEKILAGRLALLDKGGPIALDRVHSDGGIVELNRFPLPNGGLVITCRDVTERRQSSLALKQQIKASELLQHIASAANTVSDVERIMQICLQEVCSFTGWVLGHVCVAADESGILESTNLWHVDDAERFEDFIKATEAMRFEIGVGLPGRVMQTGKPAWIDEPNTRANLPRAKEGDDAGIVAGFAFPVLVGSEVVSVLEFFSEDATKPDDQMIQIVASVGTQIGRSIERQTAERRLQRNEEKLIALNEELSLERDRAETANRAKSEFLAAMSHELRTPLNAVIGFSEMISAQTFGPVGDDKYREYAEDIRGAGTHLLDLINDILDLAKVEAGSEELHEEEVDIGELVRSVFGLVKGRASQQEVQLKQEIQDILPLIRADLRKLKQIMVNLLTNAIKFSDPGGTVTLKVWHSKDGPVFQVIDTGIGMADEDIPKALSQFGQVDRNISRSQEGTGLGLPLTKALVELHGGSLDLQSRLNVGTTVTVRLPSVRTLEG